MMRTIEVDVDQAGVIHPTEPGVPIPTGRALLTWKAAPDIESALISEAALAIDWLRPEEDEAWAYMQPEE